GYVRNSGNVTTVGNFTSTVGKNRGNTVNAGNQMGNAGLGITPDCEEEFNASAIFLATLIPARSAAETDVGPSYDTNALLKVPTYDNYHDDVKTMKTS
ncbi:hypothetical protein Tco_0866951, partial [Tanacetum coccineum]